MNTFFTIFGIVSFAALIVSALYIIAVIMLVKTNHPHR